MAADNDPTSNILCFKTVLGASIFLYIIHWCIQSFSEESEVNLYFQLNVTWNHLLAGVWLQPLTNPLFHIRSDFSKHLRDIICFTLSMKTHNNFARSSFSDERPSKGGSATVLSYMPCMLWGSALTRTCAMQKLLCQSDVRERCFIAHVKLLCATTVHPAVYLCVV